MWATATRHIPGRAAAIVSLATDTATWPEWLSIARTPEPISLHEAGARAPGTLMLRRRAREVTWEVARRLRDIVELHAFDGDGDVIAKLTISCSRWYDDCVTELRLVTTDRGRRPRRWAIESALRRSLARLDGLAGDPRLSRQEARRHPGVGPAIATRPAGFGVSELP